jgi:hypothetical protein
VSTPENTSKNRNLLDEVRDVMRLHKDKIVAVTILSCDLWPYNNLDFSSVNSYNS